MIQIQLYGYGNMGSTLVDALDEYAKQKNTEISIHIKDGAKHSSIDAQTFKNISVQLGVNDDAEIIILAVKPNSLDSIDLERHATSSVLVSVLAGTSTQTLHEKHASVSIMRVMPNLLMNAGMSTHGLYLRGESSSTTDFVKAFFGTTGEVLEYEDEEKMHAHTALFGSGPGIVSSIIQNYIDIAKSYSLGLTEAEIRKSVLTLFAGTAAHLQENNLDIEGFFDAVASKGGTTEAFGNTRESSGGKDVLAGAVDAAVEKSKEKS